MRLSAWQYVFYLTIIFAIGYANAGAIAKRAANDKNGNSGGLSGIVKQAENALDKIPLIGSSLSGSLKWVMSVFNLFEQATNGAIARLLGGALPCKITLDGTSCSGLKNNGGLGKVLMNVLDGVPSLILPGFVKSLLKLGIESLIDPTADVIFGGVSVPT